MNNSSFIYLALLSLSMMTQWTTAYTVPSNNNHQHKKIDNNIFKEPSKEITTRRTMLNNAMMYSTLPFLLSKQYQLEPANALESGAKDASNKFAPEFVQTYGDFTKTDKGWQYKDVKIGNGDVTVEKGDRVVFDWSGYTIGYFGRPFEAKGGPQGGAFDKDLDYFRTVVGSNSIVPGLEEAMLCMKPGGIRQVVIPYGPLSYPADDLEHNRVGPKPTTFSGQRALNFVLENPRIDRTLLFNVKLIRVDKADGKGGFIRGDK